MIARPLQGIRNSIFSPKQAFSPRPATVFDMFCEWSRSTAFKCRRSSLRACACGSFGSPHVRLKALSTNHNLTFAVPKIFLRRSSLDQSTSPFIFFHFLLSSPSPLCRTRLNKLQNRIPPTNLSSYANADSQTRNGYQNG